MQHFAPRTVADGLEWAPQDLKEYERGEGRLGRELLFEH